MPTGLAAPGALRRRGQAEDSVGRSRAAKVPGGQGLFLGSETSREVQWAHSHDERGGPST